MAITSTDSLSGPYFPNGVTTSFPFHFRAPSVNEIAVLLRDAAGNDSVASGYTVTLTASGGTVTFAAPPAAGPALYIMLDPDFTQLIEFENGAAWLADPVNETADRAAQRDLVLRRDAGRALKLPVGEVAAALPGVAARAGKLLGFDAGGHPLAIANGGIADPSLRAELAQPDGASRLGYNQGGLAAVTRDLRAKLQDIIHLKDKGWPVTAATLQAAVNDAAAQGKALYLGDENFSIGQSIVLPDADIAIHGAGAATLSITFTGTSGLFVGTDLSPSTNIDIGGFRAVAGAPNCGRPVVIEYSTSTGIDIRACALTDIVTTGDATNYWTGGALLHNARNSIVSSAYTHGPTSDLSKTIDGLKISGQATDVKVRDFQAVSVGKAIDIVDDVEGTVLTGFVAVDVNVGVSKVHSGDSEPWLAMANWHINCRQKGIYLDNVLQTTIAPGLLYCQNGVGDWIGIHVSAATVVNQDIAVAALIDGQLAGGGVTSMTGMKIDSGNGINADLKMRSISVGIDVASTVTNSIFVLDPNNVASVMSGAGALEPTNRIMTNLPGIGYGLPATSGPYNADSSSAASKSVRSFGFAEDTIGNVKGVGGYEILSLDANWVNAATRIVGRRGDALVYPATFLGTGTPEGVVAAPVGSIFTRADGGAGSTLYVKETGTGNTGWAAK